MKKKTTTSKSQYCYMVTGILAAHVRNGEELTINCIKKAVAASVLAFELISKETDLPEEKQTETDTETVDYFAKFPWNGCGATYTELENWIRKNVINSKHRANIIIRESKSSGLIYQDSHRRYWRAEKQQNPESIKPCSP